MAAKQEIFKEKLAAYLAAPKEEKGRILDAVCAVAGVHRKAAVRRFRTLQTACPSGAADERGRPRAYGYDITAAVRDLWELSGRICGERLHPMIPEYVRVLMRDRMWRHDTATTRLLLRMRLATVKRRIARFPNPKRSGGRSATKPSALKELVPIRRGPWENPPPGKGEVDTVAHCGSTLLGDYAYTVQYTDVATIWTCLAAQWQKGEEATLRSIERIERRLPFPLRGLDPDSGSEFVNWHLARWCRARTPSVELTRTRPYMKNDHARIEQKNYANVRRVVGYRRLDDPRHVAVLAELYEILEDYLNFFVPSMVCVEKVLTETKRTRRRYEEARTAYARVLARPDIPAETKETLRKKYAILNPKVLRETLDRLLAKLSRIPTRLR